MTVSKLIKKLRALEKDGLGSRSVCVDKSSLFDGNDTFTICDIEAVEDMVINIADDDGFMALNKDGSEKQKRVIVIKGPR